ncbi:MAG: hypothetical protein ACKOJH_07025 [Actinomycetota bacterium]
MQASLVLAAETSDRTAGVVFLVSLLAVTAVWWAIMRRRQMWWWGYARRPSDTTGERWIRSSDARADKPMPERRVTVDRRRRR